MSVERIRVVVPTEAQQPRRLLVRAVAPVAKITTVFGSSASGGGSGTVTSVGLSLPTGFTVSGSPVTSSGTLAATFSSGYQAFTSAESSKLAGIESGATGDQSAAEILAALLTVDGSGSGLDADLLDGNSAAAFALAGHDHSGVYQPADAQLSDLAGLSYAGNTLKVIRVNAGETGFELATISAGGGDALTSGTLDQFADVTQTGGATLAITASTTLSGGTHSGTNTGDQDLSGYVLTTAIDTLAELNAIITDATLIDTTDSRLSDARTPTSHVHGNLSNAGAIGSTSGLPIKTGASGVLEAGAFGTSAGQFAEGNDARFHDAITLAGTPDYITISGQVITRSLINLGSHVTGRAALSNIAAATATAKILARISASGGDFEEASLSQILDLLGSVAQGDILYRGASAWSRLAAGTSGHFLKTLGGGANPEWAAVTASLGGTYVCRTSTQTVTETTATEAIVWDSSGTLPLTANAKHLLILVGGITTAGSGNGARWRLSVTSATVNHVTVFSVLDGSASTNGVKWISALDTDMIQIGAIGSAAQSALLIGFIDVGSPGGTLNVKFAPELSSSGMSATIQPTTSAFLLPL